MSLENNELFEKFCEQIAKQSLSHYLLVRWSYSTYLDSNKKRTESVITKLDSSLLRRTLQEDNFQLIHERTQTKLQLSNYTEHINVFFEKLFGLPEKLKKHEKPKRNDKLREYLSKVSSKFLGHKCEYLDGIAFPIGLESNIVVSILNDYCFTFSTKERVPFKLVIETISYQDAYNIKKGVQPVFKSEEAQEEMEAESYILPQTYFGTEWKYAKREITNKSVYGKVKSHQIKCYMVKSGDDLRQ